MYNNKGLRTLIITCYVSTCVYWALIKYLVARVCLLRESVEFQMVFIHTSFTLILQLSVCFSFLTNRKVESYNRAACVHVSFKNRNYDEYIEI